MGSERTVADFFLFMLTRWGRHLQPAAWDRPALRAHFLRCLELRGPRTVVEEQGLPLPEFSRSGAAQTTRPWSRPRTVAGMPARLLWLGAPPLGGTLLALASLYEPLYRFLVREDSLLEWAQVLAYLAAAALGALGTTRLWRLGGRSAAATVAVLAIGSLVLAGEELSWGQRLLGFGTPEVFADNRQGEATLHNDARLEAPARAALLVVGLYGVLAPLLVRRAAAAVPPLRLAGCFAVVAVYSGYRLALLPRPTYAEAKFSEWPELCLAVAVAAWVAIVASRREAG